MFTYAHVRTGQPVKPANPSGLCQCSCHPPEKPPPTVEARLCQECADERFRSWADFVEITLR